MTNGSISLGRIRGIPLSIHWSVAFVAIFLGSGLSATFGAVGGVAAVVAFLASILVHEISHALVARRYGVGTQSIQLWAMGGVARLDREAPTARAQGWIAVAGPLASLAIGAFAVGIYAVAGGTTTTNTFAGVAGWLGVINIALAMFNLLPGSPLDGGHLMKAWRWGRHGDRFRAGREAATSGRAVGWSIAVIGIVLLLNGLPGLIAVVTGAFIALSAKAEIHSIDLVERLQGVRVSDLTWFGIAHAPAATDADTMVFQRGRLGGAGVVAVDDATGSIAGVVDVDRLLAIPEHERQNVEIGKLMVPTARLTQADPDEELSNVLIRLNPLSPIITVWRDGKLLGVVPKKLLLGRLAAAE